MRYKRRKKYKKTLPKFLVIIIVLIILMHFGVNSNISFIKSFFNEISTKVERVLILNKPTISDEIILGINRELELENNELKKLTNNKETNYEMITALVVKRNIDWYSELTIDKGKKDGIDINMAVIDKDGLIGKIKEVGDTYSKVSLITSNYDYMKVSASIINDSNNYHGILTSYNKETDSIITDNISKNSDIKIGDKVYTNGLGGVYPSGIYIGEVSNISYDKLGLNKIVEVKRNSNFDNINYVNVIRR